MHNVSANKDGEKLIGTGEQLRAYLGEAIMARKSQDPPITEFDITMTHLLASRIEDGVPPSGFALATLLLTYDCMHEGDSSSVPKDEILEVTGHHPAAYGFFALQAVEFAHGAFGEAYATEVRTTLQMAIDSSGRS